MRQILETNGLIGKTIRNVFDDDERDLYLVFEDDTFCILRDEGYSDDRVPPSIMDYAISLIPDWGYSSNIQTLIKLGVYTEEERNAEIQRREDQRKENDRKQKELAEIEKEKRDKREYARLKKKFESSK